MVISIVGLYGAVLCRALPKLHRMVDHADSLRSLAERYLRMASMTDDLEERRKFLEYAGSYAELVKQIESREQARAAARHSRGRGPPGVG